MLRLQIPQAGERQAQRVSKPDREATDIAASYQVAAVLSDPEKARGGVV